MKDEDIEVLDAEVVEVLDIPVVDKKDRLLNKIIMILTSLSAILLGIIIAIVIFNSTSSKGIQDIPATSKDIKETQYITYDGYFFTAPTGYKAIEENDTIYFDADGKEYISLTALIDSNYESYKNSVTILADKLNSMDYTVNKREVTTIGRIEYIIYETVYNNKNQLIAICKAPDKEDTLFIIQLINSDNSYDYSGLTTMAKLINSLYIDNNSTVNNRVFEDSLSTKISNKIAY